MMQQEKPPLLVVDDLKKHFVIRQGLFSSVSAHVYAVDGVSFHINEGETLGLVGESGCGKSTAGKALLKLIEPTAGTVKLRGERIDNLSPSRMRPYRRELQVVFQDPYSSLNPRLSVGEIVAEPMVNFGVAPAVLSSRSAWRLVLAKVGLRAEAMARYPHEFSGGQRQRIGIARALSPSIPVSLSVMSQYPHSTCPSRRKWSTYFATCSRNSGSPIFLSPTIWRWSSILATASR